VSDPVDRWGHWCQGGAILRDMSDCEGSPESGLRRSYRLDLSRSRNTRVLYARIEGIRADCKSRLVHFTSELSASSASCRRSSADWALPCVTIRVHCGVGVGRSSSLPASERSPVFHPYVRISRLVDATRAVFVVRMGSKQRLDAWANQAYGSVAEMTQCDALVSVPRSICKDAPGALR